MAAEVRGRVIIALLVLLVGASSVLDGVTGVQPAPGLLVGYYKATCPAAEKIIQKTVAAAYKKKKSVAPGILRLHFHDCFVHGCDGSVLIDSTSSQQAEKDGRGNANSLRGFEVIDSAKTAVEAACPGVVSCADVLAYAARDSVVLAGGQSWAVEGGRRDGSVSSAGDLAGNLPPPFFNVDQLTQLFASKGLSQDEMVTLSGGHSIGQAHCIAFASRINASNPDSTLNAKYAKKLNQLCPDGAVPSTTLVNMEPTPNRFDSRYYSELLKHRGLFTSDQVLANNAATRPAVMRNANSQTRFLSKFAKAMVQMGRIGVLTGSQGNVRFNCRVFNT